MLVQVDEATVVASRGTGGGGRASARRAQTDDREAASSGTSFEIAVIGPDARLAGDGAGEEGTRDPDQGGGGTQRHWAEPEADVEQGGEGADHGTPLGRGRPAHGQGRQGGER